MSDHVCGPFAVPITERPAGAVGDLSIRAADRRKDPLEGIGVEWAVRRSSQLVEVEDCAGAARDGASDDGHALGGELGAGLGLEGGSQSIGLGQARLQVGEFVSIGVP
jgi:hypothetical protein